LVGLQLEHTLFELEHNLFELEHTLFELGVWDMDFG
jgi:hypothetical protein